MQDTTSYPVPSSVTGCIQRPHVAHVHNKQFLSGFDAGYLTPLCNSVNKCTSAVARRASERKMSPIPVPRRRMCRGGSHEWRLRLRGYSTRCGEANIQNVGAGSVEGARSKRNAGFSIDLPRRYDSVGHANISRTTSSSVLAQREMGTHLRNGPPLLATVHCRRGTCGDQEICAPSSPLRPRGHSQIRHLRRLCRHWKHARTKTCGSVAAIAAPTKNRHRHGRQRENSPGIHPAKFASDTATAWRVLALYRRGRNQLRRIRPDFVPAPRQPGASQEPKQCATCAPPIIAAYAWYPLVGVQRNVIWGFENGYHSSRKGQSERATWPPETLIGHPPLSSKAGVDPQTALANQSAPRCHLGLWFAIDPSAPKPAKPD